MDLGLSGKVVLVTGGAGRLGRAICKTFTREGAHVGVADLSQERAAATAQLLATNGTRATSIVGDVSSRSDVERMLGELTERLGPVDVLVNAHGIFPNVPLLEVDVDDWDRVFAINTRGTMLTCQAVGRQMVARGARGSIINLSSGAATSARMGGAGYCGSKAAVNLLTEVLAIELGPHGIRVNAVAPGLVLDHVMHAGERHASEYVNLMLRGTPIGRTGAPQDIAEAVVYLAGENNGWLTGSILPVSGGSHCGRPHVPLSRELR
jgi:NAD(P)-dependent dehydrogenase (short-subunit alcohol dehydrogenase family)